MTAQLALFAGPTLARERTGRERKADAMARLQGGNARWLEEVRGHARWHAFTYGEVTADDLAPYIARLRLYRGLVPTSSNAMGAVFAGHEWEWTGRWVRSERAHMHSTDLRVWRLKS